MDTGYLFLIEEKYEKNMRPENSQIQVFSQMHGQVLTLMRLSLSRALL